MNSRPKGLSFMVGLRRHMRAHCVARWSDSRRSSLRDVSGRVARPETFASNCLADCWKTKEWHFLLGRNAEVAAPKHR